ncbi:hypothetical protein R3P38DRAFT_3182399 [Favolaschia claudopus]|uniref:N-acetyltransferase domain-containing protein n=1 Tax=Favolaschia claudopus TaxID=2862362 RepID=A0AAW0CJD8_9AGAR
MSSPSTNLADPAYRRTLADGKLAVRWSTKEDRAGCVMLSCLAVREQEGQESEKAVRYFEPFTDDQFHSGSSTNWAVCVETNSSPTEAPKADSDTSKDYADTIRKAADSAQERVVAVIYLMYSETSFDGDAVRVPIGRPHVVACKPAYRGRIGGENIMNILFDMVHARAHNAGCAFALIFGIPAYYRTQGYEYALNMGHGLITHTSTLGPPSPPAPTPPPSETSAFSLRQATSNDVPALERLVLASRTHADIFITTRTPENLTSQLRWMVGERPPGYAPPEYPHAPFFVLEREIRGEEDAEKEKGGGREKRIVAAVGLRRYEAGASNINIHPVLWDGEESASGVVQAIVPELVKAVEALPGKDDGSPTKVATIQWILNDAHPLHMWLRAHELAVPMPESSRYDFMGAWWIAINSLSKFLTLLTPALNARLARSAHLFGKNYSTTLRIAAPRGMGGAVVLQVVDGVVSSVASVDKKVDLNFKPNVTLPGPALVQLMMGYVGWRELKSMLPDVWLEPAVVPLVDVLFPRREVCMGLYI